MTHRQRLRQLAAPRSFSLVLVWAIAGWQAAKAVEPQVLDADQLFIELPPENASFHSLATQFAKDLPTEPEIPQRAAAREAWQRSKREQLREILHSRQMRVAPIAAGKQALADVQVRRWKLLMDGDWTVPAVELVSGQPKRTAVLLGDQGRSALAAQAARLLDEGFRVVALDPFYFGESKIAQRDVLYALTLAAVGDRPLGVQASQVAAAARWCGSQPGAGKVTLVAHGPRTSLIARAAAAVDPQAVTGVQTHDELRSLKDVIDRNMEVYQGPEMFCFGLLKHFDVPQLVALAAPRGGAE